MSDPWEGAEIEYPGGDAKLDGLPRDTFWSYVGSGYLDGLINEIAIVQAWMVTRYEDGGHAKAVRAIEGAIHPDLCRHDDVIVIGTSHGGTQTWVFWFDRDSSDCCIGRSDRPVAEVVAEAKRMTKEHEPHHAIDPARLSGGWRSW